MINRLPVVIIFFGLLFRLLLTVNGNFIFNMDNARDMIDVREMVELKKIRLIGPTSGIEGFFDGPAWYYLLMIPYLITSGNPYGSIVMEILLWALGGYFLIKLSKRWGVIAQILVSSIWVSSNFVILAGIYAFNPNPIIFLMPIFIYLGELYVTKPTAILSFSLFLLAGIFFNFEMAYGVFFPLIIFLFILSKQANFFIKRHFWIGVFAFALTLTPQIVFELKHNFFMTQSVLNYLRQSPGGNYNIINRFGVITQTYLGVASGTFLNLNLLAKSQIILIFLSIFLHLRKWRSFKDKAVLLSLLLILVPFIGQILIPVSVMSWHLGGAVVGAIYLTGFVFASLQNYNFFLSKLAVIGAFIIIAYSFFNLHLPENLRLDKDSNDPAVFANQIKVIDFIYKQAGKTGFKVYTYLPSVIDYSIQYGIWWHGKRHYGYLPEEYAYLPNKPSYIPGKEKLDKGLKPAFSGSVFLIKEPDRIGQRHLWENSFKHMNLVNRVTIGPFEVEERIDPEWK